MSIDKQDIEDGIVFGTVIVVMVISFIFTLADVASKPHVHPADQVVPPSPFYLLSATDQGRAGQPSRMWSGSDLLITEVTK